MHFWRHGTTNAREADKNNSKSTARYRAQWGNLKEEVVSVSYQPQFFRYGEIDYCFHTRPKGFYSLTRRIGDKNYGVCIIPLDLGEHVDDDAYGIQWLICKLLNCLIEDRKKDFVEQLKHMNEWLEYHSLEHWIN